MGEDQVEEEPDRDDLGMVSDVTGRLRRRLRDDRGFSIIELSVAMILSSMIAASLVGVFYAFSQNSGDLASKANVQGAGRAVLSEQVIRLRQAIRADLNGDPVEFLSPDKLIFYTQNYSSGQIERVAYERKNCVGGECELWVYRYAFVSTDGVTTTFDTTPFESSLLMGNVLSDQPMFIGSVWLGDPLTETQTSSCDGSSVDCDFPIVSITLRARPRPTTSGGSTPVELHEQVRIRSV